MLDPVIKFGVFFFQLLNFLIFLFVVPCLRSLLSIGLFDECFSEGLELLEYLFLEGLQIVLLFLSD